MNRAGSGSGWPSMMVMRLLTELFARAFFKPFAFEHDDAAAVGGGDHAMLAQLGDLAADGLDGQAEQVGNVLAAERQLETNVTGLIFAAEAFGHVEQEGGDPLRSALAPEQDHPLPAAIEF